MGKAARSASAQHQSKARRALRDFDIGLHRWGNRRRWLQRGASSQHRQKQEFDRDQAELIKNYSHFC
jgi:hypothetical protein